MIADNEDYCHICDTHIWVGVEVVQTRLGWVHKSCMRGAR